jgi:hypothetical protein
MNPRETIETLQALADQQQSTGLVAEQLTILLRKVANRQRELRGRTDLETLRQPIWLSSWQLSSILADDRCALMDLVTPATAIATSPDDARLLDQYCQLTALNLGACPRLDRIPAGATGIVIYNVLARSACLVNRDPNLDPDSTAMAVNNLIGSLTPRPRRVWT